MKTPLVSIGMPVFNDRDFLNAALDSLLAQTMDDFELIISDDGSTDGSELICRIYAEKDGRIRYIRQPQNIGISRNLDFLFQQGRGKYFMWAANDDVWDPQFIEILMNELEKNKDASMAFCLMKFIDEDGNLLKDGHINEVDYSAPTSYQRLKKLIVRFDDTCGYGLFNRSMIQGIQYPVWWWPNNKRAYNNIYPALCFSLSRGKYILAGSKALWFNRLKNPGKINHRVPYPGTFIRGLAAFSLWKLNVVYVSLKQIYRGSNSFGLPIALFPLMSFKWFISPVAKNFWERLILLVKGRIKLW